MFRIGKFGGAEKGLRCGCARGVYGCEVDIDVVWYGMVLPDLSCVCVYLDSVRW